MNYSNGVLNVLVTEKVMGYTRPILPDREPSLLIPEYLNGWFFTTSGYDDGDRPILVAPPYATDMHWTWTMVQWLAMRPVPGNNIGMTRIGVGLESTGEMWKAAFGSLPWRIDRSAERALCLAALDAVGHYHGK